MDLLHFTMLLNMVDWIFASISYKSGDAPLHIAAKEGHLEVCKLLFRKMEIKNPQNDSGKTPLQLASENNQW